MWIRKIFQPKTTIFTKSNFFGQNLVFLSLRKPDLYISLDNINNQNSFDLVFCFVFNAFLNFSLSLKEVATGVLQNWQENTCVRVGMKLC